MPRIFLAITVAAVLVSLAPLAHATEVVVTQEGKQFSEKNLTIKVGDSIKFVNKDEITHDVHSGTDGYDFDLGAQQPGTDASYTFTKPGTVQVRCAIHPKMKLDVTVE